MQACYSSQADGSMPIPCSTSEPLPAYPHPPRRSDAGSEGVILRAAATKLRTHSMTWNRRYQVKSYLRSSLWIIPLVALPLEQVAAALAYTLDTRLAWKGLALGVTGALAMFNAVITLTLSFIVFTFGSLLIAIQVASGQYTPRIIATTLLRDNVIRCTVGLFVFTFLFAIKAADRTETSVHQLVAFVTGLLGLICIVAFLFLIDYAARMLRPVSLAGRVGEYGLEVMESVYPQQSAEAQSIAGSQQSPGPVEADNPSSRQIGDCGGGERGDACRRGGKSGRGDRICPASRRFCWIGGTVVPAARWSCRHRRTEAAGMCRPRRRAHYGAGPALCVSHSCRYCDQGTLKGDQ